MNDADKKLLELAEEITPLPWSLCGAERGVCSCATISSPHHPIAKVTIGKWGDRYPSLRLTGPSMDRKAEAFMDGVDYGEVEEKTGKANARYLHAAANAVPRLIAEKEALLVRLHLIEAGVRVIELIAHKALAADDKAAKEKHVLPFDAAVELLVERDRLAAENEVLEERVKSFLVILRAYRMYSNGNLTNEALDADDAIVAKARS